MYAYKLCSLVSQFLQYHLRMYTLNTQFAFATKESIANLATWLKRKTANAAAKRKEADLMIEEAGEVARDEAFIREQWEAQVREQTKPSQSEYTNNCCAPY